MSSSRLPGKVLAPVLGIPLIQRVLESIYEMGISADRVVVVTSDQRSDDPLVAYIDSLGVSVFRGPLDNVVKRFAQAENVYRSDWIIRVTADSPFIQPQLFNFLQKEICLGKSEFITTTYRRTLPKGLNLEGFSSELLRSTASNELLNINDLEHLTSFWRRNIPEGGLISIELEGADYSAETVAIDSTTDYKRCNAGLFDRLISNIPWEKLTSWEVRE